jgi:hypothetical protein
MRRRQRQHRAQPRLQRRTLEVAVNQLSPRPMHPAPTKAVTTFSLSSLIKNISKVHLNGAIASENKPDHIKSLFESMMDKDYGFYDYTGSGDFIEGALGDY